MSKVNGVAEVVMNPNKWGKISIMVNDNWYSTDPKYFKGDIPERGATVEFDDGGKKYINNLTILSGGSAGSASTSSSGASGGKSYSNLGVELGHASNVAKDMAIAAFGGAGAGSDDWYKYWITHTEKVYNVMKELRSRHEDTGKPVAAEETKVETDVSDIF